MTGWWRGDDDMYGVEVLGNEQGSLATLHLDDELVAALAAAVLSDEDVDVLLGLAREEEAADLGAALRQFELLQQLALLVEEGEAAVLGERAELEEGGDEDVGVRGGERGGPEAAAELMEETACGEQYLMQQMPSLDSQKRRMRLRPVSATQMMRSSWLKARPVGAERHRSAIDRMLCCCMSITKRLPAVLEATFSPKAPQSVKKMLPVRLERRRECGPWSGAPSYSLTSSVSCESVESEITDCLSRSVRQQQLLAASYTTARTCPLTFANSFSCPSRYLMISPLNEQNTSASSVSNGEYSGEFTSRIFQEFVSEKNITEQVIIIFEWEGRKGRGREGGGGGQVGECRMVAGVGITNIFMFPATNKERQMLLGPSPKYSRDANKSTYLPYFKRFPHQKFHSQEKRRHEEPAVLAPRRFFTEEKEQPDHTQHLSSFSIKERSPGKLRPRLFRQLYERESHKTKRTSEHSLAERTQPRLVVNSSFNVHSGTYLTPAQLLRSTHNLTDYELTEVEEGYQEIYYWGQNCAKKAFGSERRGREGDEGYAWAKGDHVAYRYELVELLGEGSFGQVFRCLDHKQGRAAVALKMVKNNEKYLSQAKIEIRILNLIKSKDPLSSKNCIELREYFPFRQRICMTFGLMAMNLYELIKSNGYYGLPLDLIRRFVLQLLNGIHFLHRQRVIHADLKPENILLKEVNKSGIKIIDFGSSCLESETIYTYIQSRYYRAPEVILGLPYDRKIDIWSFGCIVAELHLGYPLFGGEDEHEQMCLIVEVLGLPPKDLLPNSKRWHVFFDSTNTLKPHEKRAPPASKTLAAALEHPDDSFTAFIRTCLQWHPERRVEALDLMRHEWVLKDLPGDFREQHLKFVGEEEAQLGHEENSILRKSRKHTFAIRDKHRLIK